MAYLYINYMPARYCTEKITGPLGKTKQIQQRYVKDLICDNNGPLPFLAIWDKIITVEKNITISA